MIGNFQDPKWQEVPIKVKKSSRYDSFTMFQVFVQVVHWTSWHMPYLSWVHLWEAEPSDLWMNRSSESSDGIHKTRMICSLIGQVRSNCAVNLLNQLFSWRKLTAHWRGRSSVNKSTKILSYKAIHNAQKTAYNMEINGFCHHWLYVNKGPTHYYYYYYLTI